MVSLQTFLRRWCERERLNEIRAAKKEAWQDQVNDVNPDIDPYYNKPRLSEGKPLTEAQLARLNENREMDDYQRAYDNNWTY